MFIFNFLFWSVLGIALFLSMTWTYLGYDSIPNAVPIEYAARHEFDYIIVGGGTVGSVLANRISDNKNISVLLIEAGHQFGPLSIVPLLAITMQKSTNDWSFYSVSQKYSSKGLVDQQQVLPRGKGLGGSSQLNYMLHFDGIERDFDEWERLGAKGWNYASMKKYFDKVRHEIRYYKKGPNARCRSQHSTSSQLASPICYVASEHIAVNESFFFNKMMVNEVTVNDSALVDVFLKAELEMSLSDQDIMFRLAKSNIQDGIRWSTYHSYLRPAFRRNNLKILSNVRVRKVIFRDRRAISILASSESNFQTVHQIHARQEIILSAGAYQTPQILKLSGIGPVNELQALKISPIVHDSPHVGTNLYDHMNMPLFVSINSSMSVTRTKILRLATLWDYLRNGRGIFSRFGVIGFANEADHGVGVFGAGSIDEAVMRDISNVEQDVFRSQFPFHDNASQEGMVLLSTCHQPRSRGVVRLASKNPRLPPLIDPDYLKVQSDIDCLIKAIRLAVKLVKTNAFQAIGAQLHWPMLRACANFGPFLEDLRSDHPNERYLECIIRTLAITSHHPGGTCAIGETNRSAVDSRLRVRGVTGLRVADASVLPAPVSGTPNSVLVAVGEHAADMILNDRLTRN